MTVTAAPVWTVDGNGWLLTPSGAKAARVVDGAIMLYDKRSKQEIPFTLQDWFGVTQTQIQGAMSHEPSR